MSSGPCTTCGRPRAQFPMAFSGDPQCSVNCAKRKRRVACRCDHDMMHGICHAHGESRGLDGICGCP